MVNVMEAQKPLVHWLVRGAGLRKTTIEIEPGTVMSFWVPKDKVVTKKKSTNKEIAPLDKTDDNININSIPNNTNKATTNKKEKPALLLVHGFAAEGLSTWQFQIGVLRTKYSLYIPDLLFFGGSITEQPDRSPDFQARCLAVALGKLGVGECSVVGFSYGGMVAFKLAESRPDLVRSLVISGSVYALTDSISAETQQSLGFSSSAELLMPESVKGLKALLSLSMHKKIWFPDKFYRDYAKVMLVNKKERTELLEGLVISNKDATVPNLPQRILLLWGENDQIFHMGYAKAMKEQLGEKATFQSIRKAGHLVHLERPCVFNRCLKQFLATVYAEDKNV